MIFKLSNNCKYNIILEILSKYKELRATTNMYIE